MLHSRGDPNKLDLSKSAPFEIKYSINSTFLEAIAKWSIVVPVFDDTLISQPS